LQNIVNEFTLAALAFDITRLHVMRAAGNKTTAAGAETQNGPPLQKG
jgi:hypothetical protein